MLTDAWGRKITYLRVSVTDRCDFRCVYCMPPEGITLRRHDEILRYEEIAVVVRAAADLGVRKVRLTGGEPLARRNLPDLVRMIAAIPGIDEIGLTTNGTRMEALATPLRDAGLTRVNFSLDTLNVDLFARITRGGSLATTLRGIEAAEGAGLTPIKINVVAMQGINDGEWLDLARLSQTRGWHVRFIELMPIENQAEWGEGFPAPSDAYVPLAEVLGRLSPLGLQALPVDEDVCSDGPARRYVIPGAVGSVGFISPVSEHFCAACNRLRLTADGKIRPCLLSEEEIDIAAALRRGDDLAPLLRAAVHAKPAGHALSASPQQPAEHARTMRQIGG